MRVVLIALSVLVSSVPTFASSRGVYPVSCNALWEAIKVTLSNTKDYSLLGISDSAHSAAFLVVGELTQHTDRVVELIAKDSGCVMRLAFVEIGPADDNERGFRKRVKKSLAKMEAAKAAAMPTN
jgi:hypothetical protein